MKVAMNVITIRRSIGKQKARLFADKCWPVKDKKLIAELEQNIAYLQSKLKQINNN